MRFHRADNLLFCSNNERDLDYVRTASELVLAHYHGEGHRWRPADSDRLWRVFTGGRAGVVGVRLDNRVCCVKLFYNERLRTKLRITLGLAKGRRAYRNGLRLRRAGVDCPGMLGYAELRPIGPIMVITELIDDGMRLDHWVTRHPIARPDVVALARYLRNMHDHGVSHVDLSPRNILIRHPGGDAEFLLLDYEDARFTRNLSRRTRLDNLHHLHERMAKQVPLRDRLCFLRDYAGRNYRLYRQALQPMMLQSTRYR